jgi:hypothetical protein
LGEGEVLDLGKELENMALDERLTPSSQSYAISLWYSSKTTVKLEAGGKKQKVVFRVPVITVIPPES